MLYALEMKIKNNVRTLDPIVVEDAGIGIEFIHESGKLKAVKTFARSVSREFAPVVKPASPGTLPGITVPENPLRQLMILKIRALQGIVLPYIYLDIDFENATEFYIEESGEEIPISSISIGEMDERPIDYFSFDILARSFLAIGDFTDFVEPSYFIVEGKRYLRQSLYVSAYNSFFLYLESLIGDGKFRERDLLERFMSDANLKECVADAARTHLRSSRKTTFKCAADDIESTMRAIIVHRGSLRHHSIENSRRWSPLAQNKYINDAYFLHQVVVSHLNKKSTALIFDSSRMQTYNTIARSLGNVCNIVVDLYVRVEDQSYRKQMNVSLPQKTIDATLATEAFLQAFETIRKDMPQAKILQLRGFDKSNGVEVFRYDLSPSTML